MNKRLNKEFIVQYKLGRGAFSKVYKVKRISDSKIYALKQVQIKNLKKKELENALNEIRILASIKHPGIIGFRESFIDCDSGDLCIVMDYAGGGDLSARIKECKNKGIRLPENLVKKFFYQIASALYELHIRQIIHRDLKTANIFLSEDLMNVKLGDMNVSKIVKNIFAYTQTGTPYYASPEVWRDEPYNTKTDIWSLGCVVYEMCMLKPPFKASDMDELFDKVQARAIESFDNFYSEDLQKCIVQLLEVNQHQRPSCEKILNFSIFNDLKILLQNSSQFEQDQENDVFQTSLLNTIKAEENFRNIHKQLPEARYSVGARNEIQKETTQLSQSSEKSEKVLNQQNFKKKKTSNKNTKSMANKSSNSKKPSKKNFSSLLNKLKTQNTKKSLKTEVSMDKSSQIKSYLQQCSLKNNQNKYKSKPLVSNKLSKLHRVNSFKQKPQKKTQKSQKTTKYVKKKPKSQNLHTLHNNQTQNIQKIKQEFQRNESNLANLKSPISKRTFSYKVKPKNFDQQKSQRNIPSVHSTKNLSSMLLRKRSQFKEKDKKNNNLSRHNQISFMMKERMAIRPDQKQLRNILRYDLNTHNKSDLHQVKLDYNKKDRKNTINISLNQNLCLNLNKNDNKKELSQFIKLLKDQKKVKDQKQKRIKHNLVTDPFQLLYIKFIQNFLSR